MKPILFNTDMVRAIQNDTKTETRRAVKVNTEFPLACRVVENPIGLWTASRIIRPKYKVGDILYVRETWRYVYDLDEHESLIEESGRYIYYADNPNPFSTWIMPDGTKRDSMPWKPSIHMPKEAARIFLRVIKVEIERLQDMTLDDFLAEGIVLRPEAFNDPDNAYLQAKSEYAKVWNSTIKKSDLPEYGWDANPWDFVYKFKRISKEEAYGKKQ